MEANALHELTPAYALDALSADEEREYEAHLARCEHCRSELTSLSEAATSLAYGIEAPPLPPQLRERILEGARAERPNVVPLRPRWAVPAAATAVAALAAVIALAIWASSLSSRLESDDAQIASAITAANAATAVAAAGTAQRGRSGTTFGRSARAPSRIRSRSCGGRGGASIPYASEVAASESDVSSDRQCSQRARCASYSRSSSALSASRA